MDGSDPVTEQEWRQRRRDPEDELDGGESLNQFYERVRVTFGAIRSEHSSGTILIVGHSLTNQMILRALLGLTMQKATSIRQSNDELYLIELDFGNPPRLWKMITEEISATCESMEAHVTATNCSRSAIEASFGPPAAWPVDKNLQHSMATTRHWLLFQLSCPDGKSARVCKTEPGRAKTRLKG